MPTALNDEGRIAAVASRAFLVNRIDVKTRFVRVAVHLLR